MVSTCISTISKFETKLLSLKFLYRNSIRYNIDRISYVEIRYNTNTYIEFSYDTKHIVREVRERKRIVNRQADRQTDKQNDINV